MVRNTETCMQKAPTHLGRTQQAFSRHRDPNISEAISCFPDSFLKFQEKPARQSVVTVDRVDYALQVTFLNGYTLRQRKRFVELCRSLELDRPVVAWLKVSAFESMNEMLSAIHSHFSYWENEARNFLRLPV